MLSLFLLTNNRQMQKKTLQRLLSALEIEALMREDRIDEAYDRLLDLVKSEPLNAHGWYLLGSIYRRHGMWMEAIDAFAHSKMIEPEGPAAKAIESIYDILNASSDAGMIG